MKAGWVDLKYISNRPQHVRPPNSRHRLVAPQFILRSKLGYDLYRERPTSDAKSRSEQAVSDKFSYDQFRAAERLEPQDSVQEHTPQRAARHRARVIKGQGLGDNRDAIIVNLERFASRNIMALTVVFSVDPGLLKLVEEAGQDPLRFSEQAFEQYIADLYQDRGWGDTVELAYVLHEKRDRFGRDHPHIHGTLPGSVPDPQTNHRRPLPFISKADIERAQVIADRTVEQQLDLTLGREWRLQVPEYVHTYDELRQEDAVDNAPDMSVVVSESVSPRPPELFSAELDTALKKTFEGLPNAPTVLFDARDLEFDGFGDTELLAGLIADLFGDDFVPPKMPIQSAAASPIEPNKTDERKADEHTVMPDLPDERPGLTAPVSKIENPVEHQNTAFLGEGATVPPSAVESEVVYPWRYTLSKSDDELAYRILPNWDAEASEGRLDLEVSWYVPSAKQWSTVRQNIFHNTPLDYLHLDEGPADHTAAQQEAEARFTKRTSHYLAQPENDFNEVLHLSFEDWTRTTALDETAKTNGFLPGFPVDRLTFDPAEEAAFVDSLPEGVTWLGPAPIEDNPLQWGIITRPDGEGNLRVYAIKQWLDERENSHFTSSEIGLAAETIEDQIASITSVQQKSVKELGPTLFALQRMSEKLGHPSIDFLADGPPYTFATLSQPDPSLLSESERFDEDDVEDLNNKDDDEIGENELDEDEQSLELDEWETE